MSCEGWRSRNVSWSELISQKVGLAASRKKAPTTVSFKIVVSLIFSVMQSMVGNASGRVGKGISAQASHRTVLDSLPSHGSCYTNLGVFSRVS